MAKSYEKIMEDGSELLVSVMSYHLPLLAENLINQIMMRWDFLLPDEKYLASQGVVASDILLGQFESDMLMAHAEITDASNKDVISDLKVTIKFADRIEFDPMTLVGLPVDQQKRIIHQAQMYTESIVLDLQGATYVAVENNYLLTKTELKKAMDIAQDDFIEFLEGGKSAFVQAAGLVNDSRNDVFEEADVQVFQFWNPNDDRTTDLCAELHGAIFTADDPLYSFYVCPLHFGCRSTYLPLGRKVEEEVTGLPEFDSLSEKAQSQKQF